MRLPNCPSCKRAIATRDPKFFPFCSERCRLVDLGRWLDEKQALPRPTSADSDLLEDEGPAEEPRERRRRGED